MLGVSAPIVITMGDDRMREPIIFDDLLKSIDI